MVHINDVYHRLVKDRVWLTNKVLDTWYITRHVKWWHRVLDASWQFHLPFRAKAFLWCVIVGGLSLLKALKTKTYFEWDIYFFVRWLVRHIFITRPVGKAIWMVISQFWASLIVKHFKLFQWVFALGMRALSSHYTRLCLIVNENNVILFSFINPIRPSFLT